MELIIEYWNDNIDTILPFILGVGGMMVILFCVGDEKDYIDHDSDRY